MDWEIVYYILAALLVGFATIAVTVGWRGLQAEKKKAAAENQTAETETFWEEEN